MTRAIQPHKQADKRFTTACRLTSPCRTPRCACEWQYSLTFIYVLHTRIPRAPLEALRQPANRHTTYYASCNNKSLSLRPLWATTQRMQLPQHANADILKPLFRVFSRLYWSWTKYVSSAKQHVFRS